MKIIGIAAGKYIAEVTPDELNKVFYHAYGSQAHRNMEHLHVGDIVPIDRGYNFLGAIKSATNDMAVAYKSFVKATPVMNDLVNLIQQEKTP